MARLRELRQYMVSFVTHADVAAARGWAQSVPNLQGVLAQREKDLCRAWKRLFVMEDNERREGFLQFDEDTRHLLLICASELYSRAPSMARLPDLDELSHRIITAVFERYMEQQARRK
ncbi:MAG: hypothetical protein GXP25_00155 [Planctomycetes bacterium]|nr:hypothetical protein [Planctomycetota bacterium]